MSRIHLLEARLANMIAAGEVVERPSGVVKELVENAIDANSTRIEIHLKQGGIKEISIIDNGCGMNREDALMAFQRHATSKIIKEDDLWNIQTLGFRGEALPSIASVSNVELRTSDGNEGTIINISNGELVNISDYQMRQGTQIIVKDLFFTLPARLKHLKAIPYEFNLSLDILQKLAMSNPHIAFLLTHDNKEVFRTNGNGDLLNIIFAIYGSDIAKSAVKLDVRDDDFEVEGYLCLPHVTRANRNHIVVFLNSRIIKAYRIQQAIINGYEKYIAEKRMPIVFINIKMDPTLVDVNVHPSKWEVRLSKEYQLYELIEKGISDVLSNSLHKQATMIADISINKKINNTAEQVSFKEQIIHNEPTDDNKIIHSEFYIDETSKLNNEKVRTIEKETTNEEKIVLTKLPDMGSFKSKPTLNLIMDNNASVTEAPHSKSTNTLMASQADICFKPNEPVDEQKTSFKDESIEKIRIIPVIDILGQLHGSYIIGTSEDGLVIIDQHAANERIKYEKILRQLDNNNFRQQSLLLPIVITLKSNYMIMLDGIQKALSSIGINIEPFGENDIIIRELPVWLQVSNEKSFILDLIDDIMDGKDFNINQLRKKTIATMACHSSVRFNHSLSIEEMRETVSLLYQCENPFHCPHGRPTIITYATSDLRKLFDRT